VWSSEQGYKKESRNRYDMRFFVPRNLYETITTIIFKKEREKEKPVSTASEIVWRFRKLLREMLVHRDKAKVG